MTAITDTASAEKGFAAFVRVPSLVFGCACWARPNTFGTRITKPQPGRVLLETYMQKVYRAELELLAERSENRAALLRSTQV